MPETLPLPQREVAASPEKGHRGKISPAAVWVASGILAEHAGSRKAEDVDSVIGNLAARKTEDLTPHHEKVGAFSTKQRAEHWEKRIAEEPNLVSKDEQISKWQDGVIDYVAKLQKQGKRDNLYAVLETLGIGEDALNHGEDFPALFAKE